MRGLLYDVVFDILQPKFHRYSYMFIVILNKNEKLFMLKLSYSKKYLSQSKLK